MTGSSYLCFNSLVCCQFVGGKQVRMAEFYSTCPWLPKCWLSSISKVNISKRKQQWWLLRANASNLSNVSKCQQTLASGTSWQPLKVVRWNSTWIAFWLGHRGLQSSKFQFPVPVLFILIPILNTKMITKFRSAFNFSTSDNIYFVFGCSCTYMRW